MPITGVSLAETRKFVSTYDTEHANNRPKQQVDDGNGGTVEVPETEHGESATKWTLGALPSEIRASILDETNKLIQTGEGVKIDAQTGKRNLKCVRFGLKNIENYHDEKGGIIRFETKAYAINGKSYQGLTDACIDSIPPDVLRELAMEIWGENKLTPAELKNLFPGS